MVASPETIERIYNVIRRHVPDKQIALILRDLVDIPGNRSFRETIMKLVEVDIRYRRLRRAANASRRRTP